MRMHVHGCVGEPCELPVCLSVFSVFCSLCPYSLSLSFFLLLCVRALLVSSQIGFGPVVWLIISEIFPLDVR